MRRFALTARLKDDAATIKLYEDYHAHPWPEVIEGTLECGVKRVYIYRHRRNLFMFMETVDDFDMERDMPKYMSNQRAREWDDLMKSMQEPIGRTSGESRWVLMKEVYGLAATDSK
jgi:L-rhamnose mutarotase